MKKRNILIAILLTVFLAFGLSAEGADASVDKAISISGSNLGSGSYHSDIIAGYFTDWGYDTWTALAPSEAQYETHIKDNAVKYCFAWAHGGTGGFENADGEWISEHEIETWLANRDKMTFAFLGHCHGMDSTGPNTLSYAFRKGSTVNTVTIGYKNVAGVSYCSLTKWRIALFEKADTGVTWKEAFDYARALYPHCVQYTEFVGDESLTIYGIPEIDLEITKITEIEGKTQIEITNNGNSASPIVHPGFAFRFGMTWYPQGWWPVGPIYPGETITYLSNIDWPADGIPIQAFPDKYCSYTDSDPTNNNLHCTAGSTKCPSEICEGVCLRITEIFEQNGKVYFTSENYGTEIASRYYVGIYFWINSWVYQGRKLITNHEPGTQITLTSYIDWPGDNIEIKAIPT